MIQLKSIMMMMKYPIRTGCVTETFFGELVYKVIRCFVVCFNFLINIVFVTLDGTNLFSVGPFYFIFYNKE